MVFKHFKNAASLNNDWDKIADDYFQMREFLLHTEKYNPCRQRYYSLLDNNNTVAAAVVYTLKINILNFLRIKSPVNMHICGIPCSVSSPGIFGNNEDVKILMKYIFKNEKGLVLILNLKNNSLITGRATNNTLPSVSFYSDFSDWNSYLKALRHNYRRRLLNLFEHANNNNIKCYKLKNSDFNEQMYNLYLQVFNNSKDKLEKLNITFFQNLPQNFILTVCEKDNNIIGWQIALSHNNTYTFFLGGLDYVSNKIYNTYFLLLSELIKDAISSGATFIELGQTAEIPKMRLGGVLSPRFMCCSHNNFLLNSLLIACAPLLGYKPKVENTKAFKMRCL